MRPVPFLLAAAFALVSAPALAWSPSAEQKAEIHCVYNTLTPEMREDLGVSLVGTEAEVAALEEAVDNALFDAAGQCAEEYGWAEDRILASVDYALAAATMTVGTAMMPANLTPDMLKSVLAQLDGELAYGFAFVAQDKMDDAAFNAWNAKAKEALIGGGVPQADLQPTFVYLGAIADLAIVSMTWEDLFTEPAP